MNACIQKLHNLNSSFIFATHFHELYELQTIQDLLQKNLKIYHLNVSFENNCMIMKKITIWSRSPILWFNMCGGFRYRG